MQETRTTGTERGCPDRDLGRVSGLLAEATARIESAAEILGRVGWQNDARLLAVAIRAVETVVIEVTLLTNCPERMLPPRSSIAQALAERDE